MRRRPSVTTVGYRGRMARSPTEGEPWRDTRSYRVAERGSGRRSLGGSPPTEPASRSWVDGPNALARAALEINDATGADRVATLVADLVDPAQVADAAAEIREAGAVDVLVLNAGGNFGERPRRSRRWPRRGSATSRATC